MKRTAKSFYILQVSDFHICENSKDDAKAALTALTQKLKEMDIDISYLIHTGDIINSKDMKDKIEQEYGMELSDEEYDSQLSSLASKRFEIAKKIIEELIKELDILNKNIVICCGNHDKVRYRKNKECAFELFQNFLHSMGLYKELTALHNLDNLNVLVLNTNISDDKKVTCVDCENLQNIFNSKTSVDEQTNWFYTYSNNQKFTLKEEKVNIIVAHQPLYDICEHIRLPYGSETQTTDFLSALQDFINGNGIYLCGDKHTSSIAASYIHDIPHYFCGHPFVKVDNTLPSDCKYKNLLQSRNIKIDYNLIEVKEGKTGQVKKIHLSKKTDETWRCQIHPIDAVVSSLYENSKNYIVQNTFSLLATQSCTKYNSWTNLSWRNLFSRLDMGISFDDLKNISEFYGLFCRLKNDSGETVEWNNATNIFYELSNIVTKLMNNNENLATQNIINIRGDYSSGKSTFLGLFYIYLLYRYSYGKINFIPAYFNMENDDILSKIQEGSTYSSAVKQTFSSFVQKTEKIARTEHTVVCYIIDGLDEQDIWSESSQDSIGRVALDILAETHNSKYIMSFCQNRLARFKNTMPVKKYYEKSYVMYFNSISIKEKEWKDSSFVRFVRYIVSSNKKGRDIQEKSFEEVTTSEGDIVFEEPEECSAIRKLRRLSINPGFIYNNYQYLKESKQSDAVNTLYMRYIDQQHQICMDILGYNFVHYAPAMAYLFTYEGYTYERFKSISPGTSSYWEREILQYSKKIYTTFIFMKKNKDAREYLLALHYNRALRYFAENPKEEIPENSIINKLIPRNISIIIKKLWRNDQNKFIIVCRNLIEKRKLTNSKPINKCTLSMLTYILAYLDKIPDYVRDEVKAILLDLGNEKTEVTKSELDVWQISGNNFAKMKKFIDLNFLHSQKILSAINANSSAALVRELMKSRSFILYNRQYMMWYYGDLTIYGEDKINNLIPGQDIVNQGIDYYNCFYTLYHKIYSYFEDSCSYSYPLLEFDLFTILDLICSRQLLKQGKCNNGFLYTKDENEREVYACMGEVLEKYLDNYIMRGKTDYKDEGDEDIQNFNCADITIKSPLEIIAEHLEDFKNMSDEKYVYKFFKVAKELFEHWNEVSNDM